MADDPDDRTDVTSDAAGSRSVPLPADGPPTGAWGSLFSTQDFAAVASVGFHPVGHVLGADVVHYLTETFKYYVEKAEWLMVAHAPEAPE